MFGMNGYPHRWSLRLILFLLDGFFILVGVLLGGILRFWGGEFNFFQSEYFFWKIIAVTVVVQIPFYYFELYDLKIFRTRVRMLILLMGSLGSSFLLLAIIYYLIPALAFGRGLLSISMMVIFLMAFFWRRTFALICRTLIRERILIIGTGELSKRVVNEIYANGQDSFEIVGIVAEQ